MSTPDRQTNPPEPEKCFRCSGEKWIPCPNCGGRGYADGRSNCQQCLGEREIECPYCK